MTPLLFVVSDKYYDKVDSEIHNINTRQNFFSNLTKFNKESKRKLLFWYQGF